MFISSRPHPRREPLTDQRFAPALKPGGITEQSCGATAPHRFTDEVTLLPTIPAAQPLLAVLVLLPMGTISTRCLFVELLLLSKQARIELATSPVHHRDALPK